MQSKKQSVVSYRKPEGFGIPLFSLERVCCEKGRDKVEER